MNKLKIKSRITYVTIWNPYISLGRSIFNFGDIWVLYGNIYLFFYIMKVGIEYFAFYRCVAPIILIEKINVNETFWTEPELNKSS